jgi:hypothetical protein
LCSSQPTCGTLEFRPHCRWCQTLIFGCQEPWLVLQIKNSMGSLPREW